MKIKIIGDTKEAQEKLGTNIKLRSGQILSVGNKSQMKVLSQKYPKLFEVIQDERSEGKKNAKTNKLNPWYKTK